MIKSNLLVAGFLLALNSFGQVGINVELPTEMLDVNGRARIRTTTEMKSSDNFDLLVTDNKGVVKKLKKTDLEIKREEVTATIASGNSSIVTNTYGYQVANIVIISVNNCRRTMISSFQTNLGAMLFINGIARDKAATFSVVPIPHSAAFDASASYIVKFPNVIGCGDGGNGSQFDFTFEKVGAHQYKITNNGNVSRRYTVIFQKIS